MDKLHVLQRGRPKTRQKWKPNDEINTVHVLDTFTGQNHRESLISKITSLQIGRAAPLTAGQVNATRGEEGLHLPFLFISLKRLILIDTETQQSSSSQNGNVNTMFSSETGATFMFVLLSFANCDNMSTNLLYSPV